MKLKLYYIRPGKDSWPVEVTEKDTDDANFWPWLNYEAAAFPHMNYFFMVETTNIW